MLGDKVHGHVHCEAARRFFGLGECTGVARRFLKITVHFNALDELSARLSFDSVVGRDAHISHLESEPLSAALAVSLRFIFT